MPAGSEAGEIAGSLAAVSLDDELEEFQVGTALTREERIRMWSALSDVFIDNDRLPAIVGQHPIERELEQLAAQRLG